MKNVLIIIILVVACSCNKKRCWQCTQTTTIITPSVNKPTSQSTQVCDKTNSEIEQMKKDYSNEIRNNDTSRVTNVFTCN